MTVSDTPLVERLEPCPFCGAKTGDHSAPLDFTDDEGANPSHIYCWGCGAQGPNRPTVGEATAAWNTRALLSQDQAPASGGEKLSEPEQVARAETGHTSIFDLGLVRPTVETCEWPKGTTFGFHDDPGEHDPCYVIMPDGAMLAFNHHAGEGVDVARARFVQAACNLALSTEPPPTPTSGTVETRTREIYDSWAHLDGWVPWVEGGNSEKQNDARRCALASLTTKGGE